MTDGLVTLLSLRHSRLRSALVNKKRNNKRLSLPQECT